MGWIRWLFFSGLSQRTIMHTYIYYLQLGIGRPCPFIQILSQFYSNFIQIIIWDIEFHGWFFICLWLLENSLDKPITYINYAFNVTLLSLKLHGPWPWLVQIDLFKQLLIIIIYHIHNCILYLYFVVFPLGIRMSYTCGISSSYAQN